MDSKTNIFQIVVICIFGSLAVLSVFVFATIRAERDEEGFKTVTVWGPLPYTVMSEVLAELDNEYPDLKKVKYIEYDPRSYYDALTEGLAAERGPDLFIIDHDQVWSQYKKLTLVAYERYAERTYKETFADVANIFLVPSGISAIPFAVDPLVLYYNTEQFASAAIAQPPKYWDEMYDLVGKLARVENDTTVTQSAIALGEYGNITNAKAILSALFLQSGSTIIKWQNDKLEAAFSGDVGNPASAVRFYTEFSNPTKKAYNWNRSLRSSKEMFLSGKVSMYIGYASEYPVMRAVNPNLSFDLTLLPQARTSGKRITYGKVYGFAITKATGRPLSALYVAQILSTKEAGEAFAKAASMPPVRRDLLSVKQSAARESITYESAIISRAWSDPNPYSTGRIFDRMITNITSGKQDISQAVQTVNTELSEIIR